MPKTTIDELLQAIEAIQILKQTVERHDQAIAKILDKLEALERRLDVIEARDQGETP